MALQVGELFASLKLDLGDFKAKLSEASVSWDKLSADMTRAGGFLTAGVTAPLVGAGVAAIKTAADFEQAQIGFKTLLGSGAAAMQFMKDLQSFAAKTPFELPGLITASRRLLAYGVTAKEVLPWMKSIGEAVSALGGGAFEIERVTTALGQMKAKGKVSAEEMRQLAEVGIGAWEMLAKKLGLSIQQTMDRVSRGEVDAATGLQAILDGMATRYRGSMEEQSKTFLGLLSTLMDNLRALAIEFGKPIVQVLSNIIQSNAFQSLLSILAGIAKAFGALPMSMQMTIIAFAALAAGLGPVLLLLPRLIEGVVALKGILSALSGGLGGLRVGLAAIAPAAGLTRGALASIVALMSGPWGLVAAGVATAAAAIVLLATKTRFFQTLWSRTCAVAQTVWTSFTSAVAWGANFISKAIDLIKAGFNALPAALNAIKDTFRMVAEFIVGWIIKIVKFLTWPLRAAAGILGVKLPGIEDLKLTTAPVVSRAVSTPATVVKERQDNTKLLAAIDQKLAEQNNLAAQQIQTIKQAMVYG